MKNEEWRAIVGSELRYEVSSLGRVRRLERSVEVPNRWGGVSLRRLPMKIVALTPDKDGYLMVHLNCSGRQWARKAHHLVLEAFVGARPVGTEASHFPDPNRKNNAATNLRWETPVENNRHKAFHGTKHLGERVNGAKLKNEDIAKVFALHREGKSMREIAEKIGSRKGHVRKIVKGEIWSHLGYGLTVHAD